MSKPEPAQGAKDAKFSKPSEKGQDCGVSPQAVFELVEKTFGNDLHARTVLSLAGAATGVLQAAALGIHAIGRGLAAAKGLNSKHATKQVDRLLSNANIQIPSLLPSWVKFVVGERKDIFVAMDWTDFEGDDQTTICLNLLTNHGRATPLYWQTVYKSELKNHRNGHEDEALEYLKDSLPEDINVTIIADQGFGDHKRYQHIEELGFDYVIRFRKEILVTKENGDNKPAVEWLYKNGRVRKLEDVAVTGNYHVIPAVVVTRTAKMKDVWCLATSRKGMTAAKIVRIYGKRFTIEETFRDEKNGRFGMGLKATHIGDSRRRDRLLLLAAIAHALMTLLGAAGEFAGLDRLLKVNTSKKRTLSLYRQGCFWYDALPNMPDDRLELLMVAYDKVLLEHKFFTEIFGII